MRFRGYDSILFHYLCGLFCDFPENIKILL